MNSDPEIIAGFEPGGRRNVLVLEFDELEDMLRARERIVTAMCGWTSEGVRFDKVMVRKMVQGAVGEREMVDGALHGTLIVASSDDARRLELMRRELNIEDQKRRAPVGTTVAEHWRPSDEQMDLLEKWAEDAVEVFPAGGTWQPRVKTARVRDGFNAYAVDAGRHDLQLVGVHGGRAFADFVKLRFAADDRYVRVGQNPYFQGLYRKPAAKRDWFPTIHGAPQETQS